MKVYGGWGSGSIAPPLSTSALDGGQWSNSRAFRFTPVSNGQNAGWDTEPVSILRGWEKLAPAGNQNLTF
jgi:hypothetical protein